MAERILGDEGTQTFRYKTPNGRCKRIQGCVVFGSFHQEYKRLKKIKEEQRQQWKKRFNKGFVRMSLTTNTEDIIQRIEKDLMKNYLLGYIALVKFLILKAGQKQVSIRFV